MNTIKRFGTIYNNMTKVMKETVLNDTEQMKKLYEKIEKLEKIIREKDIEVNLLNEKNKVYKNIIQKNNINVDYFNEENINKIVDGPKLLDIDESIIDNDNKINNVPIVIDVLHPNYSWELYKHYVENYYKEYEELYYITYKNNKEEIHNTKRRYIKKVREVRTKDIILKDYPIKVYRNIDNDIKELIAKEVSLKVKYQSEIARKLNKNEINITLDDIILYIIQQLNKPNNKNNRFIYKNKIERCMYLNDKYGDMLNIFNFSIQYVGYMSKTDWDIWLNELDNMIKNEFPDKTICKYNYNKKQCGKIDCENIKHQQIH